MPKMQSFIKKFFNVKNIYEESGRVYKKITIAGLHLNFRNKAKEKDYKLNKLYKLYNCYTSGINKEKINFEIANMLESLSEEGKNEVQNNGENRRLIVSLTSYPDRMYDIHYCLYSLIKQTLKPDKIILWLAEEEFKNRKIPQKLLDFQKIGLTIEWYHNIKSYKKLIPALKEYPNDIIVTADDDIYYPENWLECLYNEYKQNPNLICVHRCHKVNLSKDYNHWKHCISDNSISCKNFFTGAGGVLYPPNSLHCDVLNEELFTSLAPNADDIWFWAMAVLNGTKIKVCDNPINTLIYTNPKRDYGFYKEQTLASQNCDECRNDIQLNNILEHYPQIKEQLKADKN